MHSRVKRCARANALRTRGGLARGRIARAGETVRGADEHMVQRIVDPEDWRHGRRGSCVSVDVDYELRRARVFMSVSL